MTAGSADDRERVGSEYRVMLGAALTAGVTPVEAKEIVDQAVPYVGMGQRYLSANCNPAPAAVRSHK